MQSLVSEKENYSSELNEKIGDFKSILYELQALGVVSAIASWDLETQMPKRGAEYRGWALSIISKLSHEKLTSEEVGKFLNYFREESVLGKLTKIDRAIVREIGKSYDREKKIPTKLVQELSELTAKSHVIWAESKKNNEYKKFAPHLERIFSIKKEMTEYIGYKDTPYNALIDMYEPGITVSELDKIFENLKAELIPFIKKIKDSQTVINSTFINKDFSHEKQILLSKDLLTYIGYDFDRGRLDESNHPFTIGIGPDDVRVTTHIKTSNILSNIGSTIHEGGHALYELGIDPSLSKVGLGSGVSLGIHESQSRLYETVIGQSLSFWKGYFPKLKTFFPDQLENIDVESFYKAINIVQPSFIRVDSDEVTYNFHIIIRYEIEKALLENKINVEDIPTVWNEKMEKYLGVKPKTDTEGALQDVHWSWGAIGYFPTYTIGNICAAQFFNTMKNQILDVEEKISKGDLLTVKNWLCENIHRYGSIEEPSSIIQRVCNEPINAKYFVNYIKEKYTNIYKL